MAAPDSFFHPDYTVGTGISPVHVSVRPAIADTNFRLVDSSCSVCICHHRSGIGLSTPSTHSAFLPPMRGLLTHLTLPRRNYSIVSILTVTSIRSISLYHKRPTHALQDACCPSRRERYFRLLPMRSVRLPRLMRQKQDSQKTTLADKKVAHRMGGPK